MDLRDTQDSQLASRFKVSNLKQKKHQYSTIPESTSKYALPYMLFNKKVKQEAMYDFSPDEVRQASWI